MAALNTAFLNSANINLLRCLFYPQREDSANFQYEHFIVITHNFILAHNINTSRYIDYLSLVKKTGRIKMKNYFNEIINKCYMKDGKIESIVCKTGQKHIFMHS